MKITKFIHSCLLVETPERVAVFDPGVMSYEAFDFGRLTSLDDIFITHIHPDHLHLPFIRELVERFPEVRITTTNDGVKQLSQEGIKAQNTPPEGVLFFDSPHENVKPLYPQPEEIGINYLDKLTVPGDSHSFKQTKEVLALPLTGPWGSSIRALNLAIELKPKFVVPVHDWHWSDQAREQVYEQSAQAMAKYNIKMFKPKTGETIEI